ncbi:hypothetical protein Zmor_011878 [Zophobas morio]|uniref:CFA20 domain-containing protein n=1 Tax=Zophobas morio TaxID=2755281 RepID=A0AA38HLI8_9CUCU|nr:hypothetical protein Zmor_011878 [Zophobas morio]
MFRNTFQAGFLSIFYSLGSKPLQLWSEHTGESGDIKKVVDEDIDSCVYEIVDSKNIAVTYISCPADPNKTLGLKLPFLTMIIKNVEGYFSFEIQILDNKNIVRRFRASNFQTATRVNPSICTMPLRLDAGWNLIQFNLSDLTKKSYGTNFTETLRVQIHANCRLRRIVFSEKFYSEDEFPADFRLYHPVTVATDA